MTRDPKPPLVPPAVLEAFRVSGPEAALPGGEGRSVRVGGVVLKRVDDGASASEAARLLAGLDRQERPGVRVPHPLCSHDGRWVVDGWAAHELVEGQPGPDGRWVEILAAGRDFHQLLRGAARPAFLDRRTDRWAVGDRVAWGEASLQPLPPVAPLLRRLFAVVDRRDPTVKGPGAGEPVNQLVHGDLSGNVLFADGLPPAVIDFSPYWRPTAYAEAVVVVDGLLWHGERGELVELADLGADPARMLARALMFRLVALDGMARELGAGCLGELELFAPVVDLVEYGRWAG